ncbi:aspartic proteinase nepenthesin-1-like [Panicum miliaceum]|uniref:Aspartic proteinase nepenthesin-1-like n=1 Tax=Panicum miliaceum TaxID=4540 RepID=A0A3L6SWC5_PANMI|nr:aspartic proteinase nepenthesin-1-like [Panicum miliaceum]
MARPLLWFALLCGASLTFATCAGIRLELTHVDAKENCTAEERMRRAAARTHRRLASMGGVTAPVRWGGASQYIAEYLIGDPPQRAEAIIDTGSNLVWTQCSLCRPAGCFRQSLPYYNPCALGFETRCARDGRACAVDTGYGGGDISGVLGTEEFTFQSETVSLAFGLVRGFLNGASGIIGLGRGALSLVSQLGDTRFAYCLTPYLRDVRVSLCVGSELAGAEEDSASPAKFPTRDTISPSHLFVGAPAGLDASGGAPPFTTVPFAENPREAPFNTFYYLPLVGVSVGDARLAVPASAFALRQVARGVWAGGALIDSGAPFTLFVDAAYRAVRAELARQLGGRVVPPRGRRQVGAAAGAALRRRRRGPGGAAGELLEPRGRRDRLHGAAELSEALNATLPLMTETTIIGNYMQQDMHVLYDLDKGVLSFQTADCSTV